MSERKTTRTIVTLEALATAIWSIWPDAENVDVAIIFGKLIAECGGPNEKQSCWNWNFGNIRGNSPAGNFTILGRAYEIAPAGAIPKGWHVVPNSFGASVPAGKVCILPDNPEAQHFRAYDSLAEAVADYFALVQRRYLKAWTELHEPDSDPETFILALKAGGYFTGDPTAYVRNVKAGVASAMPILARMPRPSRAPVTAPQTPSSKSSQSMQAVSSGAATPLRAGEGEHTPAHLREGYDPWDGVT